MLPFIIDEAIPLLSESRLKAVADWFACEHANRSGLFIAVVDA
jgi:hypothetical protein